nr:4'-phosphopantetheinyl transferase superfamily protein [Streptomyces anulatus]
MSPPALRIGLDVLDRGELRQLADRDWFLRYTFTAEELELAARMTAGRRLEFLSGRFTAKEAILKSLGRGLFQGVAPREISIGRTDDGAPSVSFTGRAAGLSLPPVALSIAHKKDVVAAVAISVPVPGPATTS